jgi:uncharacterized protein YndB with AHSA1/START domain
VNSVRFADGPSVERQTHVAATPRQVWELCIDLPQFGRWSPENRGGRWLDAVAARLGARFLGRNINAAVGEYETISTIVVFESPARLAWAVGDPDQPVATWTFDLAPEQGGTRLRQHVRIGPGPSPLTDAIARWPEKEERIIARRQAILGDNMPAVLAGIKASLEQHE